MEEGRIGFQDSSGDLTVHHYVTEGRHRSVWEFHHWVAHQGLGCWAGLVTRCSCLSSESAPGSVKPMCSHGSINECHNYTVIRGKLLEQKCKWKNLHCSQEHNLLQRNKKMTSCNLGTVQSSLAMQITCLQSVYLGCITIAQGGWWVSRGPGEVTACCWRQHWRLEEGRRADVSTWRGMKARVIGWSMVHRREPRRYCIGWMSHGLSRPHLFRMSGESHVLSILD